ncbi:Thioesterase/thiol ester dehydrase-isomerase [Aspergillus campestris IBT 28561]|uniref:Thioesterase/thiol ester dehydrase-isomerase n=1 Tax=Aspergillus campestris (strain IBT 28561) TaxID=1392248 RepID=A0A2I1DCL0_ASPC2|nr:Thioesterase/thiol ester dehydrase-isomerase [Aspergillus campestris IBT 28561]PKY07601.1 Thioesterase/thiol ester dehydrase-isomerase [Aspergillus campestris IBT 28561]
MDETTLAQQIAVTALGNDQFISVHHPIRMGALASFVYGGNTLGVAINAAYQTVSPSHHLYSISGHFVRTARDDRKLLCRIERIRDTKSFQTRHIRVYQEDDDSSAPTLCLLASADFHTEEDVSMALYSAAPETATRKDSQSSVPQDRDINLLYQNITRFTAAYPLPTPTSRPHDAPSRISAERFHVPTPLASEAEQIAALAFHMDKGLAFIPVSHSGHMLSQVGACATLDFSMRLSTHRVDLSKWHTMEQKTIVAGNARALSEARVWDDVGGKLVGTMSQQTILRPGRL